MSRVGALALQGGQLWHTCRHLGHLQVTTVQLAGGNFNRIYNIIQYARWTKGPVRGLRSLVDAPMPHHEGLVILHHVLVVA